MAKKVLKVEEIEIKELSDEEVEEIVEEFDEDKPDLAYNPATNPVYFFDDIGDINVRYESDIPDNIEKLETSLIKEKLSNFDDSDLFNIALNHLDVIKDLEYFYNIVNQVELVVNNTVWSQDFIAEKGNMIDLEFIRKIVRIPLNNIKKYWKEYDERLDKIQ